MKKRILSFTLCLLLALTLWAPARAASDTGYEEILEATLESIQLTITDPICDSIGGEWAVLALARGGVEDDAWYGRYLNSLFKVVDECGGVLHDKKYTEYSRVILGLSCLGLDATALNTGSQVYDLVSPLLTKQPNGEYWASWQGNNGTAFALIALDCQNYFPDDAGNAVRAGLLDRLMDTQGSDGGWNISGSEPGYGADVTAMVLQAMAPYYLDRAKYEALGVSRTYKQFKACVVKALHCLEDFASDDFGSVESAAQVVVALAALNRDAANDALFGDVVSSVLAYYDGDGGFKHVKDGSSGNNQMSTEQAAYALVAYDRWKTGRNSLYDMTDRPAVSAVEVEAPSAASVTQTAAGELRVACSQACAVIAVLPDGSYARLNPEGSGDTRTFHTVQGQVIVRLVGDYDGDGKVKTLDLAKANADLLGSGVGELEALVMGAGEGRPLKTIDLAKLNLILVNNAEINW